MTMAANSSRAFAVLWKDLDRWNVDYFHSARWHWPGYVLKRLADFTTAEAKPIATRDAQQQGIPIISKINFGGELFLRCSDDYKDYKGRLFLVSPDRLIFSKINAKRGCIYFSSADQKPFAVSSEYPVLKLDTEKAFGDYVNLAMRFGPAREALFGSASGMAKARTNIADFRNIVIPLPSLPEQKTIVARWRKAKDEIAAARHRIERDKAAIETHFLADVGLRPLQQMPTCKAFAVWWKDVERWGVQMIGMNSLGRSKSPFPEVPLFELCSIGSGGTPSRHRLKYFGGAIPWVKTTEVKNDVITTTEETLTEEGLKNSSAKIYPKGSLIIAMYGQGATRGRTAKLGINAATNQACAVLFNIDPRIETDFLWYFLMSQYNNMRALASGNNQPNLNADMLSKLRVPVPPLAEQQQIMQRVASGRAEIGREREAAENLSRSIHAEIEALILGTQSLKDA